MCIRKICSVLVTLVFLSIIFTGCTPPVAKFRNVDITGADYAQGFSLTDMFGQPATLQSYSGKVVVMFFGYTQCPDICPTTMTELSEAMKVLGPSASDVQVLFVTLDPDRDTPELLKQYVPSFDKRFIGLYGSKEVIEATTREFKVYFGKVPGKTPQSYTIDHTAGTYVFDKGGKIRLFVRNGQDTSSFVEDLKILLH